MKTLHRFLDFLHRIFPGSTQGQYSCTETSCANITKNRRTVSSYIPAQDHCSNISNCNL